MTNKKLIPVPERVDYNAVVVVKFPQPDGTTVESSGFYRGRSRSGETVDVAWRGVGNSNLIPAKLVFIEAPVTAYDVLDDMVDEANKVGVATTRATIKMTLNEVRRQLKEAGI